jgi:hypothetical protein
MYVSISFPLLPHPFLSLGEEIFSILSLYDPFFVDTVIARELPHNFIILNLFLLAKG